MSVPLAIMRVGMCCSVGLDAAQTTSSFRAGVTRKSEAPLLDGNLERVIMGYLDDRLLSPLAVSLRERTRKTPLAARMLRLAGPPLRELLAKQFAHAVLPVYLAAPQAPAGQPDFLSADFVPSLAVQAQVQLDLDSSRVFANGGAALFTAIAAARDELLVPGRAKFVIVGGVDSYFDNQRIATLERAGRLRTSGPQDAFTPGEAAAFVILSTEAVCRRHSLAPLAWITGLGTHAGVGVGTLANACSAALPSPQAAPDPNRLIRLVMAGLNGESHCGRDWGVAFIRNKQHFASALRVEHPAEYTGDTGAALAPLMLGSATLQLRSRTVPGPALVWACSDSDQAGALVLYPPS